MTTAICSTCGTRNLSGVSQCRRCQTSLVSVVGDSHDTVRGTPTSVLLNERWVVLGPLPEAENPNLWLGKDLSSHQAVAIKVLEAAETERLRQKFVKGAHALAELVHPNLVHVLDVVEDNQRVAYVMERVRGQSLSELLIRRERLPVAVALEIGRQVLSGLGCLHKAGRIHGQVTADNIYVFVNEEGDFQVKLLGSRVCEDTLAGGATAAGTADRFGTLVGMPVAAPLSGGTAEHGQAEARYAAPELQFLPASVQSDLYALGICLADAICGELPAVFFEMNRFLTAAASRDNNLGRIRHLLFEISKNYLAADFTDEHCKALAWMLAADPEARPASAEKAWEILENAQKQTLSAQMVCVAEGTFFRGSQTDHPQARDEEFPMALVHISHFFIDKTPVTAQQFKRYLDVTGQAPPPGWTDHNDVSTRPDDPVVFVTWEEANGYARWAGKHLPTEAEWEKAARGTDGRIYPWGDHAPTTELAWFGEQSHPVAVGKFVAGQSPYGALDMAGNVFEWVADWFDKNIYKASVGANPVGPASGNKRVLRGGSFTHNAYALRCATRGRYFPQERRANHSFRCAWKLL